MRARAGLLLALLCLVGCRDATQTIVEISTDISCSDRPSTSITVGQLAGLEQRPPGTVTDRCAPESGRIGSIVLVPDDEKDAPFAVRIVAGLTKSADDCVADGYVGGCVVARRSLSFVPHTTLNLPIVLEASCIDVPCEATQTCRRGSCVSAQIDDPQHCTEPGGCDDGAGGANGSGGSSGLPEGGTPQSAGQAGLGGASGEGGDPSTAGAGGQPEPVLHDYVAAIDFDGTAVRLYDALDGTFARTLLTDAEVPGLEADYITQAPNGDVYLAGVNGDRLWRVSRDGQLLRTVSHGGIQGIGFQNGELLLAHLPSEELDKFGILRFDAADLASKGQLLETDGNTGLQVIDDRWLLFSNLGFGDVFLADATGQVPPRHIYDVSAVVDLSITPDRRVLVPERGDGEVYELLSKPGAAPIDPSPTKGRSVSIVNPYSVEELANGNWLISNVTGLYIYDAATGKLVSELATGLHEDLTRYRGP